MWRQLLLGLILLLTGACSRATPTPAGPAGSRVPSDTGAQASEPDAGSARSVLGGAGVDAVRQRYLEACVPACERASSMRAVGWQMIQAECQRGCEGDWDLPLCEAGTELLRHVNDRVRVRGTLVAAGTKDLVVEPKLLLGDGTSVLLRASGPPHAPGRVIVVGTVQLAGGAPILDAVVAIVSE